VNRGLAAVVLLASLGCPKAATPTEVPMSMKISFSAAHLDPARPPMAIVRADLAVENTSAAPRWFLVPTAVPSTPGGVDGVEVKAGSGVTIGRFQGPGAFFAFLVPAGSSVTIQGLEIESWAEGPVSQLEVEVRSATAVTVGGEPIDAWMPGAPSAGVVTYGRLVASGRRFTADRGSVAVLLTGEERAPFRIFLH
jgi:hypothetical protein